MLGKMSYDESKAEPIQNKANILEVLEKNLNNKKVTFADGFSAELVRRTIDVFGVAKDATILDPFTGCGTTNVVAKSLGMNSVGVEYHPLLAWVARTKTYWEFDLSTLREMISKLIDKLEVEIERRSKRLVKEVSSKPKLLLKCYPEGVLAELYAIKEIIEEVDDIHIRDFLLLALISTLRDVTKVDVSWSYILPNKIRKKNVPTPLEAFKQRVNLQYNDLVTIKSKMVSKNPQTTICEGDARRLSKILDKVQIDFAFTSPPYLNNFDYADRTRLELYFLGWASSWKEISDKIRKKLIVSCSHQAVEMGLPDGLMPTDKITGSVREVIIEKARALNRIKQTKGGKKSYDIMVVAYFNDMLKVMEEVYNILKNGGYFILILGDSAPYGIHIPTDHILAGIARQVGYQEAKIKVLRERGGKWKSITGGRRHNVPLRESMVILRK
jgi:DNA modification methylase